MTSALSFGKTEEHYEKFLAGKAVIIDVREKDEVKDGMIKGASWFPLSELNNHKEAELAKLKKSAENKDIYIYCRSGNRAAKYQAALKAEGIKSENIGGYQDLVKEGIPTQNGP